MDTKYDRLFLIGNGFDKAHGYKTRYSDLHAWMEDKLKEAYSSENDEADDTFSIEEAPTLPEVSIGHHGEELFDEDKAMYLLMWLLLSNVKLDSEWNEFEAVLHDLDLEEAISINSDEAYINVEDEEGDENPIWVDNNYENLANNLRTAVLYIKELFANWIETVDVFDTDKKLDPSLITPKSLFINFNYTETLEKVYGVAGKNVDHVHGMRIRAKNFVDKQSPFPLGLGEVIVGHGDDSSCEFDDEHLGMSCILDETISSLRKPVDEVIKKHHVLWECISNCSIDSVYSFGFSYSKVDWPYVEKIIESLHGGQNVTWFLNVFDDAIDPKTKISKNTGYENVIRNLGFNGIFGRF